MMDDAPAKGGGSPDVEPPDSSDWDSAARVVRLLEVVQKFAVLDFSDVAPVGDAGDDLDALAAGINMLGEELEGWNHDFNERVAHQTRELNESVRHLQRFNEQISKLTDMSNLFQVAGDREEAFNVLGRFAPAVFADTSGAIYTYRHSHDQVEIRSVWGVRQELFPPHVAAEDCCALRHGRMHPRQGDTDVCNHPPRCDPDQDMCVPLTVEDEALGILTIISDDSTGQLPHRSETHPPGAGSTNARLALAASEQFALAVTNLELRNELRAQSIRDGLTGLYNRRFLDETLARELHRATRTGKPVSVLMLDIDHFKRFNDTYGHSAGDAALVEIATVLLSNTRSEDIVCRYGGEEFVVIMTGVDQDEATERADQIRTRIALHTFTRSEPPLDPLTASIGVVTSSHHTRTTDQLLSAADTALYRAKNNGRNRVEAAT